MPMQHLDVVFLAAQLTKPAVYIEPAYKHCTILLLPTMKCVRIENVLCCLLLAITFNVT